LQGNDIGEEPECTLYSGRELPEEGVPGIDKPSLAVPRCHQASAAWGFTGIPADEDGIISRIAVPRKIQTPFLNPTFEVT
jgi:hypothetical protein